MLTLYLGVLSLLEERTQGCVYVCGERVGWRGGNYVCSMTHLCPLMLLQGNDIRVAGMRALLPALEKLENLTTLSLHSTYGDV